MARFAFSKEHPSCCGEQRLQWEQSGAAVVIQGRAGGSDRRLVVRLGGVCSFLLVIL